MSELVEVVICDGVEELPGDFIAGAPIISLHIPSSLRYILPHEFHGCEKLRTITVDARNPVFDSREGCNAVISTASNELRMACQGTRIPESVTAIGFCAFSTCLSKKSLVIPAGVTKMDSRAFEGCTFEEIHSRIVKPADVTLANGTFDGLNKSNCKLYVPVGSYWRYYYAKQWKDFKEIIEETPYEGPEDVNGDGRVDIEDVNAVVNAVLAQ